ncbi:MAG: hypothetical protein LBO04_01120 [Spirochaetaceae bacterium]|jgi:hypothetical protein|nr:hypothetical protein [Spirochaetaceae bacterium]
MVDKFAAVIAVELPQGEGKGGVDVLEGIESPAAGLFEQGIQAYPAGSGIGGGEGEDILAGSGLPAMVSD